MLEAVLCEICNELMSVSDIIRGKPPNTETTWFCKKGHTVTIKQNNQDSQKLKSLLDALDKRIEEIQRKLPNYNSVTGKSILSALLLELQAIKDKVKTC